MKRYSIILSALLTINVCSSSSNDGGSVTSSDTGSNNDFWSIPSSDVQDGGPGKDGIPALEQNVFISAEQSMLFPEQLVIGVKQGDIIKAYPHNIMNWHEIVNDNLNGTDFVISFCPLTGSSLLWEIPETFSIKTFGVSGLLYNSNLILYDRETDSNWSQMLIESVNGPQTGTIPTQAALIETTWATWSRMYPDSQVLSEETGFSRDYTQNPYGQYPSNNTILFPANNASDTRLHPKERVLGISQDGINKVYPIDTFNPEIELLNEQLNNVPYVVIGSSGLNFAIAFDRRADTETTLNFTSIQDALPIIMQDEEGNQWDIFGTAVSGPRVGTQLALTRSFIAYWFAWTAFYPNAEIHSFN